MPANEVPRLGTRIAGLVRGLKGKIAGGKRKTE